MQGGGTGIYVKTNLRVKMVSEEVIDNNAYVICAVTVHKSPYVAIIVTVYRMPCATYADNKAMCKKLGSLICNFGHIIIAGDFYLPICKGKKLGKLPISVPKPLFGVLPSSMTCCKLPTNQAATMPFLIYFSCLIIF